MKAIVIAVAAVAALLTGCATNQMSVTYYSDPPGATITQADGRSFGRAPVTLTYPLSEDDKKRGSKTLSGVTAQWVSGARLSYPNVNANLAAHGTNQSLIFKRPADAPGLSTDMNYALELEKLSEMRRQTAAQEDAAYEARRAARAAEDSAKAAKARKNNPVTCMRIGNMLSCD